MHLLRKLFPMVLVVSMSGSVAKSAAAQTPEVAEPLEPQSVIDVAIARLDSAPVFAGMARLTFPPGALIIGGTIAGTRLFLIESGEFEFVADSPAIVHPQGDSGHAVSIASNGSGATVAGDLVIVEGNPPFTVKNTGDSPATLLDIVLWPPVNEPVRPFVTEYGVIFEPLVVGGLDNVPTGPLRLQLQRAVLPRNAEAAYEQEGGPRMLYVESGRLGVHAVGGSVTYSSAAANAPGSVTGRVRVLEPGRDAVLSAGGSLIMQIGAEGMLSNLGRTRLELLELTMSPAG